MAQASTRAVVAARTAEKDGIVNFSYEAVRAPFLARCAALCVDYMLFLALPLGWLMLSGLLSETGEMSVGTTVWVIGVIFFLCNFLLLPLVSGKTVGKALLGLTILKLDGSEAGLADLLKRNILGYLATILTVGLGFLIAAVNGSGRALHDFIGGTVVVRGRKSPAP